MVTSIQIHPDSVDNWCCGSLSTSIWGLYFYINHKFCVYTLPNLVEYLVAFLLAWRHGINSVLLLKKVCLPPKTETNLDL